MSDIPAGTKTKTPLIEESMADLAKFMKQMTGFLGVLYEAGGGDKNKAKKFSTSINDYFTQQKKRDDLEAKYGKNFDELLRIVKVISKDTKYQSEQAKLNREAGSATRKLQDQFAGGNVLDQISKNSPWLRALTGRHPELPGSARSRQHDLQDKINYAYAGKAQEQGNDPYQKMKAGGLQLREGGIVNGPGRTVVTEGDVAKLPFGISGPAELLHLDLKKLIGQKGEGNEFSDLVKKGGGGGGIGGLIGGIIPTLAKMLPELIMTALPFLIGGAVLAALIAAIWSDTSKRNKERDALIAGSGLSKEAIMKVTGGADDLESVKMAIAKLGGKGVSKEGASKAANDKAALGSGNMTTAQQALINDIANENLNNAPWQQDGALFGIRPKDGKFYAINKDGKQILIPKSAYRKIIDRPSNANFNYVPKDDSEAEFSKYVSEANTYNHGMASFDTGGSAGKAILHQGELVATKEESDDIRKLIDMASGNKFNPANKELVDLLKKQNEMIDKLLTETTKGNDILTNKEFKGEEESKETPIPIAKTKVNS